MESLVCITILVAYLLRILLAKTDPFHPVTLILVFNFLTLLISQSALDSRWQGLQTFTWMVVLCSSLSLFLGQLSASLYTRSHKLQNRINLSPLTLTNWSWRNFHLVTWVAFGLFLVGMLYYTSLIGGIPLLSGNVTHMTRSGSIDMGILNIYLLRGPEVFSVILLGAYKALNPHRWLRWLCIGLALSTLIISFMVFQSRLNIMTAMIVVAFYHHYFVRPMGLKHFFLIGTALISVFIIVASIRMQYFNQDSNDGFVSLFKLPYLYIANNWWNTDYGLNPIPGVHHSGIRYGYGIIEGIANLFPGGPSIQLAMGWDGIFNESIELHEGLNTITWHYSAWKEFGFLGVTLAPYVFGVLAEFGFYHFKKNLKLENVALMSLLSGYFILSWFEEFYQNGLYIWRIIFVWLCMRAVYASRVWIKSKLVIHPSITLKK
jgi:oligosaccharide repeat unit polymerase